jgi:hypothetical protein
MQMAKNAKTHQKRYVSPAMRQKCKLALLGMQISLLHQSQQQTDGYDVDGAIVI